MAKFLKTADINAHIEGIIQGGQKTVVLVSPYLQLSEQWLKALHDAAARGIRIIVIYGKKKSQPAAKNMLAEIDGLTLYYMKNMHAKCYFNEQQMVIASMNLYAYSAQNNKEMGIRLDRLGDPEACAEAIQETKGFIQAAQQEILWTDATKGLVRLLPADRKGACIRCACHVPYDTAHPLCMDCYMQMRDTTTIHYLAQYCHSCGNLTTTSLWYPVCPPAPGCKMRVRMS